MLDSKIVLNSIKLLWLGLVHTKLSVSVTVRPGTNTTVAHGTSIFKSLNFLPIMTERQLCSNGFLWSNLSSNWSGQKVKKKR